MKKISKFVPNNLKRLIKRLIWRYWAANDELRPFNPLYKNIIKGKHMDRYYIEKFLEKNSDRIRGACLEIESDEYIRQFGGEKVASVSILDINPNNPKATILGDLKNLSGKIADKTYDCLILTQTLQYLDDYDAALKECWRILKPGGCVLGSVPALARIGYTGVTGDYWRFTEAGARFAFSRHFAEVRTESFGNVRVAFKSLVGAFQEFSTTKEMDFHDKNFPTIITILAKK